MPWSARIAAWTVTLREVFAVLAVPIVTLLVGALVAILWKGGWETTTQPQVINFLGLLTLAMVALMGFGLFWTWRIIDHFARLSFSTGAFSAEVSSTDGEPHHHHDHDGPGEC